MKKIVLSVMAVLTFGFVNAQEKSKNNDAQKVSVGAKVGLNLANIIGDDAGNTNIYVGFNAGLFFEIPVTEKLSIQPELLYSTQGSKSSGTINGVNYNATMKLH